MTSTSRQSIATLATDLQEVLAWGEAAEAANVTLTDAMAHANAAIAALNAGNVQLLSQIDELQAEAEDDQHTITIQATEIARLTALLNPPPAEPAFTVYNEMKSAPSLPLPPIHFVYQSALYPSGTADQKQPVNIAFASALFASLKAEGINEIVIDHEDFYELTGGTSIRMDRVQNLVDVINAAKAAGIADVGLYCFPERYYGFETGTAAENVTRLANWQARTDARQAISSAITKFFPSFYFLNPIDTNTTKRNHWIDMNVDNCMRVGPGKPIVPTLYARMHSETPTWADGPLWRSTIEKVHERCNGYVIWGRGGGDDPDPRAFDPVLAWWLADEAFRAAL